MSRLTRDGTAEPVSRDQILRHARGQGNVHFPCSADHEQDWQPYPVDPYSATCDDHTYIHTYIHRTVLYVVYYFVSTSKFGFGIPSCFIFKSRRCLSTRRHGRFVFKCRHPPVAHPSFLCVLSVELCGLLPSCLVVYLCAQ